MASAIHKPGIGRESGRLLRRIEDTRSSRLNSSLEETMRLISELL